MNNASSDTHQLTDQLYAKDNTTIEWANLKAIKVWMGILLLGMLLMSYWLQISYGWKHVGLWWVGAGLGFTFYRSGYGFTRAWRNLVTGESTLGVRAHLLWLGLGSLFLFPLYHYGFNGQPVFDIMRPVGVMMLTGAFMFGIGMQIAGSCTSGSMYRFGSGQIRLLFSLIGIVVGAFMAAKQFGFWQAQSTYFVGSYHRDFPLLVGIGIQFAILLTLWGLLVFWERKRHGAVKSIFSNDSQANMASINVKKHPPAARNFIWGSWSIGSGSIVLAFLSLFGAILLARPWVISIAFPFWGMKGADALGFEYDYFFWEYWGIPQNEAMLELGLFEEPTSMMNIAFIIGAFIAARTLIRAKKPKPSINVKDTLYRPAITFVGGLLMGYGAIIGLGCNIGGFVAAVLSGSIHGWAWVIAALLGTVIGVRLRRLLRL